MSWLCLPRSSSCFSVIGDTSNRDDITFGRKKKNIRKIVVNEEVGAGVALPVRNAYSGRQRYHLVLLLVSGVIIGVRCTPRRRCGGRFALMLHSFAAMALNCGYHGAYLRRPLGERHHYRDGGRLGKRS